MNLAALNLDTSSFNEVYEHLRSHNPRHGNMHLRKHRQRNKQRVLKYLHAMRASGTPGNPVIEGGVSGPGMFFQYEIVNASGRPEMVVVDDNDDPEGEVDKFIERFGRDVLARVADEQEGKFFPPRRLSGQYYLQRSATGSALTEPQCQAAVQSGELDVRFVTLLQPWHFELLCPR